MKQLGLVEVTFWKEHLKKMRQLRALALQMLCHPDTTQEQLLSVHQSMVRTMKSHRDMSLVVRERWPRYGTFEDIT